MIFRCLGRTCNHSVHGSIRTSSKGVDTVYRAGNLVIRDI